MKNIFCLILITIPFAFATAQSKAKKNQAKEKAPISVMESLKDSRLSLSASLPAEEQWETYSLALKNLCSSLDSTEAKSKKAAFLSELLLLADKMYKIDSGKRPTDCFGPYYAFNAEVIDEIVETLPTESRERLQNEIYNAKAAFGRH